MNHYIEGVAVGIAAAIAASLAGVGAGTPPMAATPVSVSITEPAQRIDVRPRVSGRVASIHFVSDQSVQKGDVLIGIDPHPYQAVYDKARARLAQAQWRYEFAVADRTRATYQSGPDKVSRDQLDARIAAAERASADVEADKAALEEARRNLDDTLVTAPVSGIVGPAQVSIGSLVTGGQTGITTVAPVAQARPVRF
jgi:RND family efflux transporter MFP subunit